MEAATLPNIETIYGTHTLHHTALHRGYIRVGETVIEPYNGRFGTGYKVRVNFSSSYHTVEYWIAEGRSK